MLIVDTEIENGEGWRAEQTEQMAKNFGDVGQQKQNEKWMHLNVIILCSVLARYVHL